MKYIQNLILFLMPILLAAGCATPMGKLIETCETKKDKQACLLAAKRYQANSRSAENEHNAQYYYEKSCSLGSPVACNEKGLIHWNNQENASALEMFSKACKMGEAVSCNNVGHYFYEGRGGEDKREQSLDGYQKACDMNHMPACNTLGVLSQNGVYSEKNVQQARIFFEKACKGGNGWGCYNAAQLYKGGVSVEQSDSVANAFFREACNLKIGPGCNWLGAQYRDSKGTNKNDREALNYFEKACNFGEQSGCTNKIVLGNTIEMQMANNETVRQQQEQASEGSISFGDLLSILGAGASGYMQGRYGTTPAYVPAPAAAPLKAPPIRCTTQKIGKQIYTDCK